MHSFRRWGLSVVTMVVVVTAVLFLTGWGSAIASSVSGVIVKNSTTNPANVHETGTVPVTVSGTPSVSVDNLPATPTTQVIAHGGGLNPETVGFVVLDKSVDLSAYRAVTLYLRVLDNPNPFHCELIAYDPIGDNPYGDDFPLGIWTFTADGNTYTKTLDPAPPNLKVDCWMDNGNSNLGYNYWSMVTGRTG